MIETDEADKMLGALPIEAQQKFNRLWIGVLSDIESRRGPMSQAPNAELVPFIEMLIKLFYVSGYSSSLDAEKARNAEMRKAITEKFTAMQQRAWF